MGVTLSHLSALDALRTLRSQGTDIREAEPVRLSNPSPWVGERWQMSTFEQDGWKWGIPSKNHPLHVLVPNRSRRVRMAYVESHPQLSAMPANSVLWLDDCSSIVCPELLFLQMANQLSLPALVLLGLELCGHFSRDAHEPIEGTVHIELPPATSTAGLGRYLKTFNHVPGIRRARTALHYLTDHAASAPEALLAAVYCLPPNESGYGMGPVTLNERISTDSLASISARNNRYPDILFSFAPVGINYDGEDHLDLDGLTALAKATFFATGEESTVIAQALDEKQRQIRDKYLDDIVRNRQLAAQGKIVLPATKEDLYGWGNLDNLTRHILACAQHYHGFDIDTYIKIIDDTERARERYTLLNSFLPSGRPWGSSHGIL